ncbi:hypothetical protein [Desulfopila sp. IMCC35008]|uniref:hypothetical protein n=1 Tax=Desulfopila sp. IMCC35008 TaxID=2653858 RepID=UPI0013D1E285|nr:hypothetical protein [Desulfopila sp. IMCC35008]
MKRKESAAAYKGQGKRSRSHVEIFHLEVSQSKEKIETIMLYGFVHSRLGQVVGFTLSCTVHWQTDAYCLDSDDEQAQRYFSNLVARHTEAELFIPDAAIDVIFSDPELNEPIGFGSGYLKIQGSLLN